MKIEIGKKYIIQHCKNPNAKWNGKVCTVTSKADQVGLIDAEAEDGTLLAVFADELHEIK